MFNKILITALALVFSGLSLGGCASQNAKDDLDTKISAQPVLTSPQQIAEKAAESFSNAPGLSADQKKRLMTIYARTYMDSMALRAEIGQSKSLLFKTIANSNYKSAEVVELKKKITALDEKRLAVMFKALEEVQSVVGTGEGASQIWDHFHEFEFPQR